MISLLARIFLKPEGKTDAQLRKGYGILCGAVGIALNILLFAGKLLAGTLSGSIAITADAFNNLSDAGSSFVTLMGFKLAGQKPDSDHPFGHGRFEYLSGLLVSMLILLIYTVILETVGFLLSSLAMLFIFIQWFSKKKWYISLFISAALSMAIYSVFKFVLNVPIDFGFFAL